MEPATSLRRLGVIGAGNMAEAIVRGVLRAGVLRPEEVVAADVSPARRELFARDLGVRAVERVAEAAAGADVVLLSVKPQQMQGVLAELSGALAGSALVVSIAAGISSAAIERGLGAGRPWRVVRTMPNTPMLLGQGMVAIVRGARATEADLQAVRRLFSASADVLTLDDESKMDAVTAVSGSGPAYFFYLVERMIEAGVAEGLTPDEAHRLATRTALGAARMLVESADPPQELRRKVTSPNGTTQAAIETIEARGAGDALVAAVRRAAQRSRELGS